MTEISGNVMSKEEEEGEGEVAVEEESGKDIVSEFLRQNRELAPWLKSFRGFCESDKQWSARREFILRNMEAFSPAAERGATPALDTAERGGPVPSGPGPSPSPALDRLLSLSMAWANHVFLGCRYPAAVMDKIKEIGEGIVVAGVDGGVPGDQTTRDERITTKQKRRGGGGGADDHIERFAKKRKSKGGSLDVTVRTRDEFMANNKGKRRVAAAGSDVHHHHHHQQQRFVKRTRVRSNDEGERLNRWPPGGSISTASYSEISAASAAGPS